MENEIYVACWFDGNRAVMMAGTRNSGGYVTPLAVERRTGLSAGSVVNGVIALNEDNRNMVSSLSKLIANRLTTTLQDTYSVRGLYLGIMPRSMRSIRTSGEKVLDTRRYVEDSDIYEVRRIANAEASTFGDVLALYDNGFELDGVNTRYAKGAVAKKIKANTIAVVVNKRFSTDYKALMPSRDPEISLLGVMPAGVVVASAVTKEEERLEGVLSVHFCGATTLFTAYRDDQVIASCVVPFGEEDVVHDMCHGCFKSNFWHVVYENWDFVSGGADIKMSDGTGKRPLDSETIERLRYAAESRISEIFNIANEWLRAQVQDFDSLIKHIVFTGSIADKLGFIKYVEESLVPGRDVACRCGDIMDVMTDDRYSGDADYIPLVGLIKLASENCVEQKVIQRIDEIHVTPDPVIHPNGKNPDKLKGPSLFDRFGKAIKQLTEDDTL